MAHAGPRPGAGHHQPRRLLAWHSSAIAVALADHMGPEAIVGRQDVAGEAAKALRTATLSEQRGMLLDWVKRIDLADRIMTVTIKVADGCTHLLEARHHKLRRGNDVMLHIAPDTNGADHVRDEPLVAFIADARVMRVRRSCRVRIARSMTCEFAGGRRGQAQAHDPDQLISRPRSSEAILDGTQPRDLTVARLNTITNIPPAWDAQKAMFGIAPEGGRLSPRSCNASEPVHMGIRDNAELRPCLRTENGL
ncbi:MAG: hypothetical protein IPI83_05830 [Sphingomonadales bacterium]|nr:hypothetical protein [Sphingomonadales bacterium]